MDGLNSFLQEKGFQSVEGNCGQVPPQLQDLVTLTKAPVKTILEIGFNAGHSAALFLQYNPECTVLSFDLGSHPYVVPAKEYIDKTFPGRHTLVLGDSVVTLPKWIEEHPGVTYDVFFVDGCHEYEYAIADLKNCLRLASPSSLILLDDTTYTKDWQGQWNLGPVKAWKQLVLSNAIEPLYCHDYCPGRGMSWGKKK